jgi:hypothetical protein
MGVNALEGDSAISGRMQKKPPIGVGEFLLALGYAVKVVNFFVIDDSGHKYAVDRSRHAVVKRCCRPGCNLEQIGTGNPRHSAKFVASLCALWLVVDLSD